MIQLTASTKLMAAGIALSLGWIVLAACDCEEGKQEKFPGFWVACIGNEPTLMRYFGDQATVVNSDPSPGFNPADWDCSHPNSPHYKKSQAPVDPPGTPSGPAGFARPHVAGVNQQGSYLPQRLRDFPFTPFVQPPGTAPVCDSTYPDVLQTVHTNSQVTRISTCPFKIVTTIPVVSRPLQIDITPDGSTALVTSFDNAVNFIDLKTNKVTFTLMTDLSVNPNGIAITPDGSRAYVSSFTNVNPVIIVIDIASKKVIASMPTIAYAQGLTLTPDGSQLWVTSPLSTETDVIDTLSNTAAFRLNIPASTDVAFNATGTRAYITADGNPGSVVVVDTATFQTIKTYTVGQGPADIKMSAADEFLVVNNDDGGSISIIDLVKDTVVTSAVGAHPSGISFVH